jgi:hypothetical protein
MAQQKSEDRVLLEGGVMPAERAGSSPGPRGKGSGSDQEVASGCRTAHTRAWPALDWVLAAPWWREL